MNRHKNGLLLDSERRHVDQRLKLLGEDRVRDGEELLLPGEGIVRLRIILRSIGAQQ